MARPPSSRPLTRSDIEAWIADWRADAARLFKPLETGPARAGWKPSPSPAPSMPARQPLTRAQIKAVANQAIDKLNRSQAGRVVAGTAGEAAGIPIGVLRGGAHTVLGIKDAIVASADFVNSSNAQKAATIRALADATAAAGHYVEAAATHPDILKRDALALAGEANRALNPVATPQAATATDEFKRLFGVGMNQGELAFDVGTMAFGAPRAALEAVALGGKGAKLINYEQKLGSVARAERLAQPYDGMGHHAIIPRRARLPKILGGGEYPKIILDSPFNVLKPKGISTGDFYKLHYEVDPYFHGTGFGKRMGGGWSGKKLGFNKQSGLSQIVLGTPDATRKLIGILGATSTAENALDEETNP